MFSELVWYPIACRYRPAEVFIWQQNKCLEISWFINLSHVRLSTHFILFLVQFASDMIMLWGYTIAMESFEKKSAFQGNLMLFVILVVIFGEQWYLHKLWNCLTIEAPSVNRGIARRFFFSVSWRHAWDHETSYLMTSYFHFGYYYIWPVILTFELVWDIVKDSRSTQAWHGVL